MNLPSWSDNWAIYSSWGDLPIALVGGVLLLLLTLWWQQQSRGWFRIVLVTLLVSLLLSIASYYLFVVPAYSVSCPGGCSGWRGYPLRIARVNIEGRNEIAVLDFALNVLLLWLLWLAASVVLRLGASVLRWENRSRRWRVLFISLGLVLPWALLPRVLNPPQPQVSGEDLRLVNNAQRAAEFTYAITGPIVQRLAVEDMRRNVQPGEIDAVIRSAQPGSQVCLRGYTYFFIPWQRYRISLDANGATALDLVTLPLSGSCWEQ